MKRFMTLLALFVLACFTVVQAQTVQITGKVTLAEDGSPIPGVAIVVKGTTIGTSTDFDGNYTLAVSKDATALLFSYVGMKTQEVAIAGKTVLNVAMEPDVLNLGQVVVTAIGITREKRALGYTVQDVSSDAIDKSKTPNIINSLTGKVAGLRVTSSSGSAGAATFIEIRGSSSITRNNRPLFVVDGVPIITSGGVDGVDGVDHSDRAIDLNSDDIESVSVLKGGAATALYGLRASNGAIVITTKKGQAGRTQVNFNSSITIEQVSKLPERQNEFSQGTMGQYRSPLRGTSTSWGARMDTLRYSKQEAAIPTSPAVFNGVTQAIYQEKWDPNGYPVSMNSPLADANAPVKAYDPYDFFQTGISYNNNIGISGGTDRSTFYISLAHMKNEGIIPNNTLTKVNLKVSAEHKFTDKFSMGSNINFGYTDARRTQKGSNTSGLMLGLLRTPPTFDNSYGYEFPDGTQRNYRGGGGYDNPYWTVNKNAVKDPVHRMFGDFHASYSPFNWLNFTYRLGIDWYNRYETDHLAKFSRTYPAGWYNVTNEFSRDVNSDLLANIHKTFGDIDMSLTLGNNLYSSYYEYSRAYADGLVLLDWASLSNTTTNLGYAGSNNKRTRAYFGQLDLNYKSLVYLTGTLRNESSTTMPKDNNSFYYPSVSAGFVFTELGPLQGNTFLPYGKLRISYAITAQDAALYATDNYYYVGSFGDGWTTGTYFPYAGLSGYSYTDQLGNNTLKPEKMKTFEVGGELKFINNRINLDVAYFHNVNEDLLLSVPITSSTGFSSQYMNAAKMSTTGVEFTLGLDVVRTSDFKWNITTNWSNPKTMVDELAPGVDNLFLGGFVGSQIRAVAGHTYRSVYATTYIRDDQGRLMINPNTSYYAGYPVTGDEMKYIGDVSEKWRLGLTNSFSFKGITLSGLLEIKHGGMMWDGTRGAMDYFGTSAGSAQREATDLKVFEGVYGYLDTKTNTVVYTDKAGNDLATGAKPVTNDLKVVEDWQDWMMGPGSGFTGPAEFYVEDAGYIRLREVILSYDLPKKILGNTPIDALGIYFTGRNLWLKTDYQGVDPETNLLGSSNAQGMDYFNNPGTKSYTFGLRVTF